MDSTDWGITGGVAEAGGVAQVTLPWLHGQGVLLPISVTSRQRVIGETEEPFLGVRRRRLGGDCSGVRRNTTWSGWTSMGRLYALN